MRQATLPQSRRGAQERILALAQCYRAEDPDTVMLGTNLFSLLFVSI